MRCTDLRHADARDVQPARFDRGLKRTDESGFKEMQTLPKQSVLGESQGVRSSRAIVTASVDTRSRPGIMHVRFRGNAAVLMADQRLITRYRQAAIDLEPFPIEDTLVSFPVASAPDVGRPIVVLLLATFKLIRKFARPRNPVA